MRIKEIFEDHPHWQAVKSIIEKLASQGHQTVVAGGSDRDGLMGIKPYDFDVATSAKPEAVQKLFPRSLDIGKAFGIIIVPQEGFKVEIATFRSDGPYLDGRRPSRVEFTSIEEDAKRRDFTVNALFYSPATEQVMDFVDGIKDIQSNLIRAVGDPNLRFQEDKLRILRAVRFVSQLGFTIEEQTQKAIQSHAEEISTVSKERISDELRKLVQGRHLATAVRTMWELGLFPVLFPDLKFIHSQDHRESFLNGLFRLAGLGRLPLFLAWLAVHEMAYSDIQNGSLFPYFTDEKRVYLLSREMKRELQFFIEGYSDFLKREKRSYLRLLDPMGPLLTELGFMAAASGYISTELVREPLELYLSRVNTQGELPKPWITGDDLLKMGFKPSEKMRTVLEEAYELQLSQQIKTPEKLRRFLQDKFLGS